MHLVRELDDGVGAVVEEPLEAAQLALGVVADPIRDLDVLALDDRPHAVTSGLSGRRPSIAAGSARPRSSLAGDGDGRHADGAGASRAVGAGGERRAGRDDVVDEQDPATDATAVSARLRVAPRRRRRRSRARSRRSRSNWAIVARARRRSGAQGSPGGAPRHARDELGLVVAARAGPSAWTGTCATSVGADADRAQRRATAAPSGAASRCSPPYLMRVERIAGDAAERRAPLELEQRCRAAPPGSPIGTPAGASQACVERRRARRAERRPFAAAADAVRRAGRRRAPDSRRPCGARRSRSCR